LYQAIKSHASSHLFRILLCVSISAGLASGAHAQSGYSYSFSGPGISGSGDVFLNSTSDSIEYSVASMTGQVNGITIVGVLPVDTYNNNDNLFFNDSDYLDGNGVAFSLTTGANVDIYYDTDDNNYYFQGDGDFQVNGGTPPQPDSAEFRSFLQPLGSPQNDPAIELDSFTFAPLGPTPEPSSIIMLGTGLLGVAGVMRRQRKS
jgi:PEP-CTERM motif